MQAQQALLKERLASGEQLYGAFSVSFSPIVAEILGWAQYDFVVVDMEHGPGGTMAALPVLQVLASTGTPAILRLPANDPMWAKKALDLGPAGIMFPMIENADAAKNAVRACRYPPKGIRGAAFPIVRAARYGLDHSYLDRCEAEELLIMCQVNDLAPIPSGFAELVFVRC
jgi:2-keto-3-deoxy-L-rhamnonate aldolase RhmA